MRPVVDAAEALRVDVAVHLRRRQRAVAEQLLDGAQVGAALEQVGGEGVAKTVGVGYEAAERRCVEAPPARREEERVLRAACERGTGRVEVARDQRRRLLAERNDPILRTLA